MSTTVRQKGFNVWLHRAAGSIFLFFAAFALIGGLYSVAKAILQGQFEPGLLGVTCFFALFLGGTWACFGVYWLWRFPDIQITDTGLETMSLFHRDSFNWHEIGDMVTTKSSSRLKAVLINRQGMLLNRMYGIGVKWDQPVILISSKSENLDALARVISLNAGKRPSKFR